MAHRIRLREPWTRHLLSRDAPTSPHELSCQRHFNLPTGLETGDRIEVEVKVAVGRIAEIHLNGSRLNDEFSDAISDKQIRLDLEDKLDDHNQLEVKLVSEDVEPELGDVNLWIMQRKNS